MKKMTAIMLTSLAVLLAAVMVVGAVDKVEVRGEVSNVVDGATFAWNPQNFAGFYYDIDDNLGNEQIDVTITGNKLEEPNGVKYTTSSQENDFEFEDWGWYNSIGFLGENYFAGYSDKLAGANADIVPRLQDVSEDENALIDEQLLKVLIDDDTEKTLTSGSPLKLAEGYELKIKAIDIDGNKVFCELTKDGQTVTEKVVQPSKQGATMADKTFHLKKDIGDTKEIAIIGVHFKNAFRGADQDIATIDGVFQVSDTATDVETDTEFGKMRIANVAADSITMDNKDNAITLTKNKDTELMMGIHIKTADQDVVDAENPLRFYIAKMMTIEGAATEEAPAATEPEKEPAAEPAKEPEKAVEENKTATEPAAAHGEPAKEPAAEPAKEPAKEPAPAGGMPGFEAVFAVTGLLAVAYLVSRKQ